MLILPSEERSTHFLRGVKASPNNLVAQAMNSSHSGLLTWPRYVTIVQKNSHFDNFNDTIALARICKISATC